MKVICEGLPADHPDTAPIQALVEDLFNLTQGKKATVVLSSLLSVYRQGLHNHPELHEVATKHLLQISDELMASKTGQAAAPTPAPAGAPATLKASVGGRAVEVSGEVVDAAATLLPFINKQGWHHNVVLAVLQFLFYEQALANRCCLPGSVNLSANVALALREAQAAMPEAERAGQPLH